MKMSWSSGKWEKGIHIHSTGTSESKHRGTKKPGTLGEQRVVPCAWDSVDTVGDVINIS